MSDPRLLAVIMRLSEDMAAVEKALAQTQKLLKELTKDAVNNSKRRNYLAQQQPRLDGTFPNSAWVRLQPFENDEEQ